MKKLLFILTIILFSFSSQAQGRLQFNQVLTFNGSGSSTLYTVPVGKVCKVVKGLYASNSSNGWYLQYKVNGTGGNIDGMWLKEGDVLNSDTNYGYGYLISLIEYNITPE